MMERSIINVDYDGLHTQGKNGVCRSHGFDEDDIMLSTNFYLVNAFKPLLGKQNTCFGHFCAHLDLQSNMKVLMGIISQRAGVNAK